MEIIIDIPEKKAPFVLELLKNLKFLKFRKAEPKGSFADFRSEWAELSSRLPQTDPDITEEEILAEVKAVRAERSKR
ncbi:hypothetical protein [Dyadobacter fermentans]|uniref:Uncharacterized protein n=1 Tax=Dyadobacter fermentans (strain ATCC 700827 / DSM 18053 / CIP 107007 / KCTC 52180 / NS114) TaxID=471854 RepID=C6VWE0_DYAFD|nr:hypothetical protein [Dyadobacter fermentans]ACT94971.1 hypothetical protein Dfer_3767 [Dyadobacter fermentans DSM 18053]